VEVDWIPSLLANECAKSVGLEFDEQAAGEKYARLIESRWLLFTQLNLARSEEVCRDFWREITHDWIQMMQWDPDLVEPMLEAGDQLLYGKSSKVFRLYDDVVPCLEALKSAGVRMMVISNWDNSLHRVVRHFGLNDYFDSIIASLEEGVEKPDPLLFSIALDRVGAEAKDVVHVGDNPLDDVKGALDAGLRAILLDRSLPQSEPNRISSLHDLPRLLLA